MEEKVVETTVDEEKFVFDKFSLFEYKCLEEKRIGKKAIFRFQRDDSVSYIEELRKLEDEYGEIKIKKPIPLFIFPVISFLLISAYLILIINRESDKQFLIYTLAVLLPGVLFIAASLLFTLWYVTYIKKVPELIEQKNLYYQSKIQEIKVKK